MFRFNCPPFNIAGIKKIKIKRDNEIKLIIYWNKERGWRGPHSKPLDSDAIWQHYNDQSVLATIFISSLPL